MSNAHLGTQVPLNATDELIRRNSTETNLNQLYQSGDSAFIIVSACLVLLMVPGIACLYSGLTRRKSALSMLWVVMVSFCVIIFQWYFWGFSLAFSPSSNNGFIGNLHHVCLRGVWAAPALGSPLIPALLYSFYQMMFCAVAAALTVGAVAERGRVVPATVFIFFWATLVYCPLAYWVWNPNGWCFKHGVIDYAGGVPVEIGSGFSALAYSSVLGRRNEHMMMKFRPHNISLTTIGTILLWFGWLGFNGGSAFGANLRAVMACWNSCLTATFAALAWCLLDFRLTSRWSMVSWCSGAISGLVAATPASGFIDLWASIVLGVVAGLCCNVATKIKYFVRIDDSLDVFAEHGIGGMVGLIFNAFFATKNVIGLDGVHVGTLGGFLDHKYVTIGWQIAAIATASAYTFTLSFVIAEIIDSVPGLKLRASEEAELIGMDDDQHGEFSYDYVEVRRDFLAWSPQTDGLTGEGLMAEPQHGIQENASMVRPTSSPPAMAERRCSSTSFPHGHSDQCG